MIRLNPASSKTQQQRRRNQNNGVGNSANDADISGLLGNSTGYENGASPNDGTLNNNNNLAMSKSNALFEELLGEDASAIFGGFLANNDNNTVGESTAMSSVFLGLDQPQQQSQQQQGGTNELMQIPDEAQRTNNGVNAQQTIRKNSNNSNQEQHHQQHNQEDENDDQDTYMTKPREITFDPHSDDISGLFGGYGGASTANTDGVESFMGTFASQRKNRRQQKRGGGNGMRLSVSGMGVFGARGVGGNRRGISRDEESKRTGASYGVNSILEEIGLRSIKENKSVNSDDYSDHEKGHNSSKRNSLHGGRKRGKDTEGAECTPKSLWKRCNTTLLALMVVMMYVVLQIPTVQKRDKMAMQDLNWRFQNRYEQSMNRGTNYGEMDLRRRRGGRRYVEAEHQNGGDDEWNNLQERQWEHEQLMMDDGTEAGNLRGNNKYNMNNNGRRDSYVKKSSEQSDGGKQLQMPPWNFNPDNIIKSKTMDMGMQVQEQQNFVQSGKRMGNEMPLDEPQKTMSSDNNIGNAMPRPGTDPQPQQVQQGKSMSEAVDNLNVIDPKPPNANDSFPSRFNNFADLNKPYVVGRDTPFFWHIPRSGGVVVKTLLSHCLRMTLAAEVGELEGHDKDEELKVVTLFDHNYTNVNIATPEGIERAQSLGLVPSHIADALVSAHVDLIPTLYNSNDLARGFVMFRHPIDRAASMYYFLKEMGNERLKDMTLDDYAKSDMIENNWIGESSMLSLYLK